MAHELPFVRICKSSLGNNGYDESFLESDNGNYVVIKENNEAVLSLPVYGIEMGGVPGNGSVSADKVTHLKDRNDRHSEYHCDQGIEEA